MEFALLAVAGFLAGLVQIPARFSAYPNIAPATLIGTNKVASMPGTATAAVRYGSRFVRKVFIVRVLALILKTAYDAFIR